MVARQADEDDEIGDHKHDQKGLPEVECRVSVFEFELVEGFAIKIYGGIEGEDEQHCAF